MMLRRRFGTGHVHDELGRHQHQQNTKEKEPAALGADTLDRVHRPPHVVACSWV